MTDTNTLYGLTALPADQSRIPPVTAHPKAVSPRDVPIPDTALAKRIDGYARSQLPSETYSHSRRVFTYGIAIARECFPQFNVLPGSKLEETWFLTAMLHDIGTCPHFISKTKLSFEFWGGFHALQILQDPALTASSSTPHSSHEHGVASREQAESVAEAIIRHQDVQDKGSITLITRLIHLGTLLDNIGAGSDLVHKDTIRMVNDQYSRKGWSGCFVGTVKEEKELKGWAMVSRIEGFEDAIEKNARKEL